MRRWRSHRFPMVKLLLKTHVCRLLQPEFSLNFTQKRWREATPETCQRTKHWNGPRAIKALPGTAHRRCPILCPGRNRFNRDLQFRGALQLYLSVYHQLQAHPSPKRCQSRFIIQTTYLLIVEHDTWVFRFLESLAYAVNFAVVGSGGGCKLALEAVLEVPGHVSLIIAYCP